MFSQFFQKKRGTWKDDALAGLTVALALVPGSIAFAFVAGAPPLAGLYAGFFVCLITAAFGGRPGMISSAAGSLAVVMIALVAEGDRRGGPGAGLEYLFLAVILMGLIQVGVGLLRLGRLIRLVPHPVMMGFVNGLAIVVFISQLRMFRERDGAAVGEWLHGLPLYTMLGLVALTMAVIYVLPRFTKKIPSSLAAIIVVSLVALGLETQTVGDLSSVKGPFPLPHWPGIPLTWETLRFVAPYAFIFSMVGLVETLMTLQLIDEITETRGKGNREAIALGAANIVAGLFKGMGGCALVGESLINITSGGRGRMSGVIAAGALLAFIVFGSPLIDQIPIAALTGVMFVVIAVFCGVVLSALVFAWKSSKNVRRTTLADAEGGRIYGLEGLLYFGSVRDFSEKFDPAKDPDQVTLDFHDARVCDLSGLEAIRSLAERYRKIGKVLHVRHLSPDCRRMLERAGSMVDVQVADDDPAYLVARLGW